MTIPFFCARPLGVSGSGRNRNSELQFCRVLGFIYFERHVMRPLVRS